MTLNKTYLLTGGVRSGKSSYALQLASSSKKPFYIATGWAGDDEMSSRIKNHKEERNSSWTTIEERCELKSAIENAINNKADMIIVDCLTMWTCNLMYQAKNVDLYTANLIEALKNTTVPIVMVTNEVGLGIVPESRDGRDFRDLLGWINQKIAKVADKVIFMVSGIPMVIK